MSSWLHNMSVAPRTVITRTASPSQDLCRKLLFRIPLPGKLTPSSLMRAIDPGWRGRGATDELRKRIQRCAQELTIPSVAPVLAGGLADDTCEDLLSVCTVLAKSSGAVYLRDKEPNLERLKSGASVLLLIPKTRPIDV